MNTKSFIAGLAISMTVMGSAMAEDLTTMEGIPAEAMSHSDMDKVEGRFYFAYNGNLFAVNDISGDIFQRTQNGFTKINTWSKIDSSLRNGITNLAQSQGQRVPDILKNYDLYSSNVNRITYNNYVAVRNPSSGLGVSIGSNGSRYAYGGYPNP